MQTTFKIRSKDPQSEKPVRIFVRLKDGQTTDITIRTPLYIEPKNWNKKKQRPNYNKYKGTKDEPEFDRINDNLDGIEKAIRKAFQNEPDKSNINKDWLNSIVDKYLYPQKFDGTLSFFEFIEKFIERSGKHINTNTGAHVTLRTIQNYQKTYEDLIDYKEKHKLKSLDWQDVDMDFYYNFVEFLKNKPVKKSRDKTQRGMALNTIGKRIRTLKVFLNAADAEEHPVKKIYKQFKAFNIESDNIYLTEEELKRILNYDFSNNKKLERTRDMFIIASWVGLRYGDVKKLKPENFTDRFIRITQSKTNKSVVIPIHPMVKQLLTKYDNKLPEPISNQKFNENLKEVMEAVAAKENEKSLNEKIHQSLTVGDKTIHQSYKKHELVSSHTARRSFATNLYLKGVPSITIMKVTGHKTESAFLKYIKVSEEEHAKKIEEMWNNETDHLKIV